MKRQEEEEGVAARWGVRGGSERRIHLKMINKVHYRHSTGFLLN